MATTQGFQGKLGISASNPVDARFEFISCSLAKTSELFLSEGIRGVRYRDFRRAKISRHRIGGQIVMEPSITEIDRLLPWVTGGATSMGVTTPGTTLAERYITVDKIQKVYTYEGCVPTRVEIAASETAQAMRWTIDVEGESEATGNAGTFPAIAVDTDESFFMFHECSFAMGAITVTPRSFRLVIDNAVDTERWLNSLTRNELTSTDSRVSLELVVPFNSVHLPLYDTEANEETQATLNISDGVVDYEFAFTALKQGTAPVENPGRGEMLLNLNYQVLGDNDGTPVPEFTVTKTTL